MRIRPVLLSIGFMLGARATLAASGLAPPDSADIWPQWQARITLSSATLAPVSLTGLGDAASPSRTALQSGAVFSDYYLDAPGLRLPASLGGLRATGGLMVGPRGLALGGAALPAGGIQRLGLAVQSGIAPWAGESGADAVPYIGVGYTGLSLKGGWGVTADLGLVAEHPRALFGNQGWDSTLRDLRLSPVLQVGVRYAF